MNSLFLFYMLQAFVFHSIDCCVTHLYVRSINHERWNDSF